ncbi:hypothetical protein [Pararhizobium sp. PWRC1-1]|uniref:hypothetical protein n=1 Tax=Pararhizobium sp. PWRC1-1 TaxID=2804566 RepID=UPI003CF5AE9B
MTADLPNLVARLRDLADDLEGFHVHGHIPEIAVEIEDWVLLRRAVPCLAGRMSGHPTVRNGHAGATTELFVFEPEAGIARTFNRWYRLGRPQSGKRHPGH